MEICTSVSFPCGQNRKRDSMRVTGTVKWFSDEKRYGFIRVDGQGDVIVYADDLRGQRLKSGQRVSFDIVRARYAGGPRAIAISGLPSRACNSGW